MENPYQQFRLLQAILFTAVFLTQQIALQAQSEDCLTPESYEPTPENTLCDDYGEMEIDVTIAVEQGVEYSSNLLYSSLSNKNRVVQT